MRARSWFWAVLLLGPALGLAEHSWAAEDTPQPSPGTRSLAYAGRGGGNHPGVGSCGGVIQYGAVLHSGDLALWDAPMGYQPAYGPWIPCRIEWVGGVSADRGVHLGGWRLGASAYVTTREEVALGSRPRGAVHVHPLDGGYETYVAESGAGCVATGVAECAYLREALSQARLVRWGGNEAARGSVPATLLSDPRGFVRWLPDGGYEVYGGSANAVREVRANDGAPAGDENPVVGYEAWLSALVDRQGLALRFEYDARMRLHQVVDATARYGSDGVVDAVQGGVTRFYYPDTDPRWSADTRAWHGELTHAAAGARTGAGTVSDLLTAVVDPYGRRVEFEYEDMLTHMRLGEIPTKEAAALLRDNSHYWRLSSTLDVIGVRSGVRYACGHGDLARSEVELAERRLRLMAMGCLLRGGQVGPAWNQVSETLTPAGTTRYFRVNRPHADGRSSTVGWVVVDPDRRVERWESIMGTASAEQVEALQRPRPNGQGQLQPILFSTILTRPVHVPASAWPAGFGTLSPHHRLSFHWTHKAMGEVPRTLMADPAAPESVGIMPPLELAEIKQYLRDNPAGSSEHTVSPLVMAEKSPLTGWVYYYRAHQSAVDEVRTSSLRGDTRVQPAPTVAARVMDDGSVQATYHTYNELGYPLYRVDPLGRAQEFVYAENQRDLRQAYQVRWNAGRPERVALLAEYGYNAIGQLTSARGVGASYPTQYKYGSQAPYMLKSVIQRDSGGQPSVTEYAWSEEGPSAHKRVTRLTVRGQDGLTFTWEYKGGVLVAERGAGRETVWWGHDAFGRPGAYGERQADGQVRTLLEYQYDGLDLQNVRNAIDGSMWVVESDALGRPQHTRWQAADGRVLQSWMRSYDLSGAVEVVWGPNGEAVRFAYDLMGRLVRREESDRSAVRLAYERTTSRIRSVTDARAVSTYFEYDLTDQLTHKRIGSEHATPLLQLVYDPVYARVSSQVDPLGIRTYHYDARQPYRLVRLDEPLPGLAAQTRLTLDYDPSGRMQGWQLDGGDGGPARSWVTLRFNDRGLVERYSNEMFTAIPRYEEINEALGMYGELYAVDYQLPPGSVLPEMILSLQRTGPDEGRTLRSRGYQTADGAVTTTLRYDGTGRIRRVEGLIGGGVHNYQYDDLGQLSQSALWRLGASGMEHISTIGYRYDDAANRLALEARDVSGRTVGTLSGASYISQHRMDTYQRQGEATYAAEYDSAGNMLFNPQSRQRYEWNADGRLARIVYGAQAQPGKPGAAGDYTQFTYDAQGKIRRIQEAYAGTVREDAAYVWVGGQLVQKWDVLSGRLVQTYNDDGYADHASDGVVSAYLLLKNHQGSVVGKTDLHGRLLERVDYSPEGVVQARQVRGADGAMRDDAPRTDLPFGYAGYWQHARSGLAIAGLRFYDSQLSRWISRDPIGEAGGSNLYAYVGNRFTQETDPSGLVPRWNEVGRQPLEDLSNPGVIARCEEQRRRLLALELQALQGLRTRNHWEGEVNRALQRVAAEHTPAALESLLFANDQFSNARLVHRGNLSSFRYHARRYLDDIDRGRCPPPPSGFGFTSGYLVGPSREQFNRIMRPAGILQRVAGVLRGWLEVSPEQAEAYGGYEAVAQAMSGGGAPPVSSESGSLEAFGWVAGASLTAGVGLVVGGATGSAVAGMQPAMLRVGTYWPW